MRRIAEEMLSRADAATRCGDHLLAASLFAQAAVTFRLIGDPLRAAHALLELGGALLAQGRGERLPALAARVEDLCHERLPHGGLIHLRICALLLGRADGDPGPFEELLAEVRRLRGARTAAAPPMDEDRPAARVLHFQARAS